MKLESLKLFIGKEIVYHRVTRIIMKILIVTDAWHPQINGVVRTLDATRCELAKRGHEVKMLTPENFKTLPCPTYPEIRLSLFPRRKVTDFIEQFLPDAIHIATEGPLGIATRRHAVNKNLPFTTAYHTRFPEYVNARTGLPLKITYKFLRWFHKHSHAVMVPTKSMLDTLVTREIGRPALWPRGVDLDVFKRQERNMKDESPVFIYVGRVSPEKNIESFLKLDLPGEKWVIGDGPVLSKLKMQFPDTQFFGAKKKSELSYYYSQASVFVFPSRTDTFGLVLLEAMACGLPVAAYPVTGPLDIIGNSGAGSLNTDLGVACTDALKIAPEIPLRHVKSFTWEKATEAFEELLIPIMHSSQRQQNTAK